MRRPGRSLFFACLPLAALLLLSGCHSPWIQCTIVNRQTAPVSLVEVNYPGGTFGIQTIAAGASYHYRFRNLSSEQVTLDFTDVAHHDHTAKGPQLLDGQQGTLRIEILPDNKVAWSPNLTVYH
jgi:hypothetical protein